MIFHGLGGSGRGHTQDHLAHPQAGPWLGTAIWSARNLQWVAGSFSKSLRIIFKQCGVSGGAARAQGSRRAKRPFFV